jgi:DNA-binding NarL/FixJ family response regulator
MLEILLAEDNRTFAASVGQFISLISGAHLIGHALNGEEALEKALQLHPDLILMDISMPKMNGLQVAAQLRILDHPPTIIFLSMHNDAAYREAARNAGGADFVTKANFVAELLPLSEQLVREQSCW